MILTTLFSHHMALSPQLEHSNPNRSNHQLFPLDNGVMRKALPGVLKLLTSPALQPPARVTPPPQCATAFFTLSSKCSPHSPSFYSKEKGEKGEPKHEPPTSPRIPHAGPPNNWVPNDQRHWTRPHARCLAGILDGLLLLSRELQDKLLKHFTDLELSVLPQTPFLPRCSAF